MNTCLLRDRKKRSQEDAVIISISTAPSAYPAIGACDVGPLPASSFSSLYSAPPRCFSSAFALRMNISDAVIAVRAQYRRKKMNGIALRDTKTTNMFKWPPLSRLAI